MRLALVFLSGCATTPVLQRIPELAIPGLVDAPTVEVVVADKRIADWWEAPQPERVLVSSVTDTLQNRVAFEFSRSAIAVAPHAAVRVEIELLDAWWVWRRIAWYDHEASAVIRLRVAVVPGAFSPVYVVGRRTAAGGDR